VAPSAVQGLQDVTALTLSDWSGWALRTDGSVVTWGDQWTGPSGGVSASGVAFTVMNELSSVVAIAAAADRFCALGSEGTVTCQGVGLGNQPPLSDQGLSGVTALFAGGQTLCALRDGGATSCWGRDDSGQLGVMPWYATPQLVLW